MCVREREEEKKKIITHQGNFWKIEFYVHILKSFNDGINKTEKLQKEFYT